MFYKANMFVLSYTIELMKQTPLKMYFVDVNPDEIIVKHNYRLFIYLQIKINFEVLIL